MINHIYHNYDKLTTDFDMLLCDTNEMGVTV